VKGYFHVQQSAAKQDKKYYLMGCKKTVTDIECKTCPRQTEVEDALVACMELSKN